MNESGMESLNQNSNETTVERLREIVESLSSNLTEDNIRILRGLQEQISEKISNAKKYVIGANSEERVATELPHEIPSSGVEKGSGENKKILLRSAIDTFLIYVKRNIESVEKGRLEGDRRGPKGVSFLTSAGGLYASRWETPSQVAFLGDKRQVEGKTGKEKTLSDSVGKDDVLKKARNLLPNAVAKIEALLKEYDEWGESVYERSKDEWDFNPTASFVAMSNKICGALEEIKSELK